MAKEGDVSWVADIISWGMPFVVIPVGAVAVGALEIGSWIAKPFQKKLAPPGDYRDDVLRTLEEHRRNPARPATG